MARGWLRRLGLQVDGGEPALALDFPAVIARQYPREFPLAWNAVQDILTSVADADLAPLARRSPALRTFSWRDYLECSVVRMVRVLQVLERRSKPGARILDYGAYFGNMSLMLARAGYRVDAIDSYAAYDNVFARTISLLAASGCRMHDFATAGFDLHGVEREFDAVLCMGVIEHIPHTPRPLLESVSSAIRPGGTLILDTPNLAYLYNRRKLARGETIFCPLPLQYDTEVPFEGHHREYTTGEVRWMLERSGHHDIAIETFNYSHYTLGALRGEQIELQRQMDADPDSREVIFAVSTVPER